jgi:hypothetical protein
MVETVVSYVTVYADVLNLFSFVIYLSALQLATLPPNETMEMAKTHVWWPCMKRRLLLHKGSRRGGEGDLVWTRKVRGLLRDCLC